MVPSELFAPPKPHPRVIGGNIFKVEMVKTKFGSKMTNLKSIVSINKTEKQHYEHRFLLTVDMMYRKLAKALHETNIQGIYF